MRASWLSWLAALAVAGTVAAQQSDALSIVVIDGEDGVNIIQQRTAVQPVVEVRDRNKLPVAGAVVTFRVDGGAASFGNGASQISITTDASGKATAAGLQPVQNGAVNIQVTATYQGQTATATITQTNFATAADAARAGKAVSSQSSSGAAGGAAGAGAAVAAGTASGNGAAAGAGAGAGGGGGGLPGAAIGGIVGGAAVAGIIVAKKAGGDSATPPDCSSQDAATQRALNAVIAVVQSCGVTTANCDVQLSPAYQQFLNAASAECTCLGTTAANKAEKDQVVALLGQLKALGFNTGNLPACFQ